MPQMLPVLRERAIGMLTAGMSTRALARELNVNFSTISRLQKRFREFGSTSNRPHNRRPRVTTRGVTVHKIHGLVRYDTVVSRFGTFSIRGRDNWLRSNVGNISVLNHEGKPMDITQVRVCTHANFAQDLCRCTS